jgi:hypothetical protein
MSDGNNGEIAKPKKETIIEGTPSTVSSAPRRSRLGGLKSDLQHALQTWDVLSEQVANKVSPEEEQLSQVKQILSDLKAKLKQFDNE